MYEVLTPNRSIILYCEACKTEFEVQTQSRQYRAYIETAVETDDEEQAGIAAHMCQPLPYTRSLRVVLDGGNGQTWRTVDHIGNFRVSNEGGLEYCDAKFRGWPVLDVIDYVVVISPVKATYIGRWNRVWGPQKAFNSRRRGDASLQSGARSGEQMDKCPKP